MAGLPGTGKSTLARELAEAAEFCVIRSDVVRKELAGLSGHEPTPAQLRESLYTAEWNDRVYAECLCRAEYFLGEGKRVIVDATFREEQQRVTFMEAAIRWGVPPGLLLCQAEPETIRRRLEARQGDASDADCSVYRQVAEKWEEIGAAPGRAVAVISTEGSPAQVLSRALEVLPMHGLEQRLAQVLGNQLGPHRGTVIALSLGHHPQGGTTSTCSKAAVSASGVPPYSLCR